MAVINPPTFMQARNDHTAALTRLNTGSLLGTHSLGGGFTTRGGVHPDRGNRFAVTQTGSPSMAVVVRQGTVFIQGTENGSQGVYVCHNDNDVTLSVNAAPGAGQSRIDIVQARVRDSQYSGGNNDWVLEVKAGTAAASPVAPATDANGVAIALINVASSATSILSGNITWLAPYANALGGYIEVPGAFYYPPAGTIRPGQRIHDLSTESSKIWNSTAAAWETVPTIQTGTYTPGTPSGVNLGATGSKSGSYKVIPSIRMIFFSAIFQFNGAGSAMPAGPTLIVDFPPGFPPSELCSGAGWFDWGVKPLGWRGLPGGTQLQLKASDNVAFLTNFTPGFTWLHVGGWYPY